MTIREYRPEDIPSLTHLWSDSFGDPESFVAEFLSILLPANGSCFVAEYSGRIISAAYILTGAFVETAGSGIPAAYLYSVATDKAYRGLGVGKAVCRACVDYARGTGCRVISTLPASDSLYSWYSEAIGVTETLSTHTERVKPEDLTAVRSVSPEEYYALRCSFLEGEEHLSVPLGWIKLLDLLCRSFGGGLFASRCGICACSRDESGSCVVTELLPADALSLAASAAAGLGCNDAICRIPGGGDRYIAHDHAGIPHDITWNLTLD